MPSFILAADLHIRSDRPRCRIDEDWEKTQELMIKEIVSIANEYKVPLIITGDLFDTPNIPSRFIVMLIEQFNKINTTVHFLAGNHELPYHSLDNINNSSIGIFSALSKKHSKIIEGMDDFGTWHHFNSEYKENKTGLLFMHELIFENSKSIPPNVNAKTAQDILDEHKKMKWIFTGDNHKCFMFNNGGRYVINPGCAIRQKTDEQDYKPSILYVNTEKEKIKRIYLSDDIMMVDDNYIIEEKAKIDRITSFVEKIKKNENVSLDFIENIENSIKINKKLNKDTVKMIRELIEEEK